MKLVLSILQILGLLIFCSQVYSLSCRSITEEFYFSCVSMNCKAEFQKSFKKGGGGCSRRPILLDVDKNIESYLLSEIKPTDNTFEDGIYRLNIHLRFWRYEPTRSIEKLKETLRIEYKRYLKDPGDAKESVVINIKELLNESDEQVSLKYIGKNDQNQILGLEKNIKSDQYLELIKYILYLLVYWGSGAGCLFALIYSTNRFYLEYSSKSMIDKKSLAIQIIVLGSGIVGLLIFTYDPWLGVLFLPAVVVILIAESWLVIRTKFKKQA